MSEFIEELLLRYHITKSSALECGKLFLFDKDETPLKHELNVIVPVSFAESGGYFVGSCFSEVRNTVLPLLSSEPEPFSDRALLCLHEALKPFLTTHGYAPAAFPTRYAFSCIMEEENQLRTGDAGIARELTFDDLHLCNHTSMKLSDCIPRGACAVIQDGIICAIAAVNSGIPGSRFAEIGVECAPPFRRRGYATACVACLAGCLLRRSIPVLYQYYRTNEASSAVARKVGFRTVGRFFSYTAFQR